jgi:hypothetical protein
VAELLLLEFLDVRKPIPNPAAELDEARPCAGPSPSLKGTVADVPAIGQLELVEVPDPNVRSSRDMTRNLILVARLQVWIS